MEGDEFKQVRRIVLALPGVTGRISHGEPCFFVQGRRRLCYFHDNHRSDGRISLWCPAPPGCQPSSRRANHTGSFIGRLRRRACSPPGSGVYLDTDDDDSVDWGEIAGIVEDAFRTVAPRTLIDELDHR